MRNLITPTIAGLSVAFLISSGPVFSQEPVPEMQQVQAEENLYLQLGYDELTESERDFAAALFEQKKSEIEGSDLRPFQKRLRVGMWKRRLANPFYVKLFKKQADEYLLSQGIDAADGYGAIPPEVWAIIIKIVVEILKELFFS